MSIVLTGDRDHRAAPPPAPARHRLRETVWWLHRRVLLPVLGLTAAVAVWWWTARSFGFTPTTFPAPPDVVESLRDNHLSLLEHSWVTLFETLAGFGVGTACGLLIAGVLATSTVLERATMPVVICLNAIPIVAVAPLLVFWLGLGHPPRITLAALICFFPIMLATKTGLTSTPAELGDLARSLSAGRWRTFFKIRVPWALPQVFVGLKLGMTLAVIGAVVAQMHRPDAGLGYVILVAQQNVNTSRSFAAILLLMVLNIGLFYTVVLVERLLLPWARETTSGDGRA